jgi:sigma-B regulation protein RsbU (phosphoserine phosphatase)
MKHKCNCGMDLDIDLAAHVQQLLFPKNSPLCNWCCIGTENRMASGLGGDYFDFITMPDQRQAIFIGDVTGHGLHASVVMSLLYGYIHRAAGETRSALDLVQQVNDFLQTFATRSREFDHYFSSSLFFGVLHPGTLEMEYVNAGHPMPMVRRAGEILTLPSTGSPIGFFDDTEFGLRAFRFEKDDRLLLFTDGIIEARGLEGRRFGLERLKDVLLHEDHDHLHFLDELFRSLRDFGASDPPVDDCTAIVVDFHGPIPA